MMYTYRYICTARTTINAVPRTIYIRFNKKLIWVISVSYKAVLPCKWRIIFSVVFRQSISLCAAGLVRTETVNSRCNQTRPNDLRKADSQGFHGIRLP